MPHCPRPKIHQVFLTCGLFGLFLSGQAMAQETAEDSAGSLTLFGQKASLSLGLGANIAPAYEGSKDFNINPIPMVNAKLFNDRIFLSNEGVGANIIKTGHFQSGLAIAYGGGRTSSDSDRLTGLKDLPGEAALVGFMKYDLKPLSFEFKAKNYFGPNPGTQLSLGSKFSFSPTAKLHLSVGPQVTWADSRYNKAHFGITEDQAAAAAAQNNPLQVFTPGSGITDVGLSFTGRYDLSEHWGLMTRIGLTELVGYVAKDSPLTEREFQPSVSAGLTYRF